MTAAQTGGLGRVVILGCLLILACLACIPALLWLRKRLRSSRLDGRSDGFSIGQLRELHQAGQLTGLEFNQLRQRLLGLEPSRDRKVASGLTNLAADDDGKERGTETKQEDMRPEQEQQ